MSQSHAINDLASIPNDPGGPPLIRVYQIPALEISYLTALVEAYEGIGLVRTLDASRGLIELWIMPDYETVFDRLLENLRAEFPIQRMPSDFD